MASSAFSNTSTGLSVLVRSLTLSSAPYTIRSEVDFLPLSITWFMNLARIWLPYLGSGRISRFAATRRLGMISPQNGLQVRSEERRVGKECRSRWGRKQSKKEEREWLSCG